MEEMRPTIDDILKGDNEALRKKWDIYAPLSQKWYRIMNRDNKKILWGDGA